MVVSENDSLEALMKSLRTMMIKIEANFFFRRVHPFIRNNSISPKVDSETGTLDLECYNSLNFSTQSEMSSALMELSYQKCHKNEIRDASIKQNN